MKAELKISETIDNPNRLLFRCPKGACRFFEWWKVEDDKKYFSENKSEHLVIDGSGIMGDNIGRGRFQGNRVFNSRPCSNYGKNENESEILLKRLVTLEESNGFTLKLLYALFVSIIPFGSCNETNSQVKQVFLLSHVEDCYLICISDL